VVEIREQQRVPERGNGGKREQEVKKFTIKKDSSQYLPYFNPNK
jgi:hypothetical protein